MVSEPRSERPRPTDTAEIDVVAGRYEVEEVVGRGGMGAVYRVRDKRTGEQLALKRLRVRKKKKDETLALFEREFHTLGAAASPAHHRGARLRHRRARRVLHDGAARGRGHARARAAAWPLACRYLREVASSLALLHARKLVHRDVTPQNVRVTADGHCKLIDFGALADFGASGAVIGTPPCVPPEAVDGKPLDQRLDLYALGCLGYYLLTGRHAYPATDSRQLRTFWARTPAAAVGDQASRRAKTAAALAGDPGCARRARDEPARARSDGAAVERGRGDRQPRRDHEAARRSRTRASRESYLASVPLCGRKLELQKVKLALERTLRGRGTALMIDAAAGLGRTRLLAESALLREAPGLSHRADRRVGARRRVRHCAGAGGEARVARAGARRQACAGARSARCGTSRPRWLRALGVAHDRAAR